MKIAIIWPILLLVIGSALTYFGYKILDNRKKYEFDNMSNGGVVQFKDWKATKKHALLKGVGKLIGIVGVLVIGVGLVMILTRE